jgi:endonuclease/exonuclease/phosphatase family metal-dependent hydrolase
MKIKAWRIHLLSGLVFWFGLQIIRVFLPSVMWFLSQTMGEYELALYALVTFGLIFIAPLVGRMLTQKMAVGVSMAGIIVVRLVLQFVGDAFSGLILSTLGLALFVMFLPLWLQSDLNRREPARISIAAVSFPLVFLVDTTTRTLFWSYDLIWRTSWWALILAVGLTFLAIWLLWDEIRFFPSAGPYREPPLRSLIPLAGFGAWLYLGYGMVLNPQALMALTGWEDRIAHLVTSAVAAVGMVLAVWVALEGRTKLGWVIVPALAAVLSGIMIYLRVAPFELWWILLGLSSWLVLGRILRASVMSDELRPGLWRTCLVLFLGFLSMLIFIFLNEFNAHWVNPISAGVLALMGMLSAAVSQPVHPLQAPVWRQEIIKMVGWAARAAVAVVVLWMVWNQPVAAVPAQPGRENIRVMTYNIHQGLNADIYMDLEEIAREIDVHQPDIIGLNEVNRGRANNGYTDTLALISRRLQMPYIYGANFVDGQYGNAILSRFPILEWDNLHYATNTTEIRGLLRAAIDLSGEEIIFFSTHLDHIDGPRNARSAQILEAIEHIPSEGSIFTGDLNANPQDDEMQPLYQAGLVDALVEAGLEDAGTFWSRNWRRIDYIFVTPDLVIEGADVIQSRASDHLPVIADLRLP